MGWLSVLAGVFIIIEWFFQIPLFQIVKPGSAPMVLGAALGWIILGGTLIITQVRIKKNEIALKTQNKDLEKKAAESSAESDALLEKLKNCNGRYQSVIDRSFDAIYVLDFEGNFIEVNPSMCKMTGYTRNELLKLNTRDIIDPEQLKTDPFIPFHLNYEQAVIRERRLVHKTGKIFEVEINIKKIADDRVMVIANDITRRRQLENELHEAGLKFHALADHSAVGVYVLQKEKLVYINTRYAEIFGYEPYELTDTPGSIVDVIISENYRAIVRKNIYARYLGKVEYVNYEITGKKKDGTFNRVEFSGSRAVIDGEPTIIGTMIDVTQRWTTEEALKLQEANLQTILDTADIAYALFDKNLKVTAFNQLASKFSADQYNHTLKKGDHLRDYSPADKLPEFTNAALEVLKGSPVNYEINYRQPNGAVTWYYVRLLPIIGKEKRISGLMVALSNVTERKVAEDNLHEAYQRIQRHINSIKEMAWKQSHLIRSPLANLKGLVMLLKEDPSDKEILNNILTELERLDKVIIDLANDASDHNL